MYTAIEFIIPNNVRIADLIKELIGRFPVQTDKAKTITRIYYDSFDWRLFNKKLQLLCEIDSDGQKVIMCPLNDPNQQRTLSVDKIPAFASEFDSFVFRNKLMPILDVRALIPQFTVQYRCNPLRYVDKEQKTCLQISIENPKLALPNGQYRMLGKRIRLIPVRGYAKPAEQIRRHLKKVFSLAIAEKDVFTLGLELLDIHPADFSSKLKLKLDAGSSTGDALKYTLLTLLRIIEQNEEGVIKDIDTEFLHDFRVAVRRSRSALSQVKHTFRQDDVETYRRDFSWLGGITGPTRDMHVYLLKFSAYQQALPEDVRPQLEPLRDFLKQKKQKEHKLLVKHLRSHRYKKLKRDWRGFLDKPLEVSESESNAEKPVKQVADARIWKMYRRVIKEGKGIGADSPNTELHQLRISCKKLRYLLEFFENLYPGAKVKRLIGALKHLQDILGDFNDYHVQIESLTHIEEQMAQEVGPPDDTKQAIDRLVDILKSQQQALRSEFKTSFSTFNQKKYQSLFKLLFGSNNRPGKKRKPRKADKIAQLA